MLSLSSQSSIFCLEEVVGVHLVQKVVHLVGLGDCDPIALVFDLVPVQLMGEGCDMCARRVATRLRKVCLDGELLLCFDEVPRLELLDHRIDCIIFVTHVVLFELFYVLCIDGMANSTS